MNMDGVTPEPERSHSPHNTEVRFNPPPNKLSLKDRFARKFKRPHQEPQISQPTPDGDWNKTIRVVDRLQTNGFYEEPDEDAPNGYFKGRPIIGRDTAINGGVYVGSSRREAIVVDFDKSQTLRKAYEQLQSVLRPDDSTQTVLRKIFTVTSQLLPYSELGVDQVNRDFGAGDDKKISLGVYVGKAGVCRHQALLAGAFAERMIYERKIQGKVSVDRNYVKGRGGHAWVRFEEPGKKPDAANVTIIDPAQQFVGKLKDVPANAWFYTRPTDNLPKK